MFRKTRRGLPGLTDLSPERIEELGGAGDWED
jgi:hypothetical protein